MLPFLFAGLGLLAYFHWQGDAIAANHAKSVNQAIAAASVSQATPAAARTAAPLIIGPPGSQTTLTQTGESIAAHTATAPAYNPPPVQPTLVLPTATTPLTSSTHAKGVPTGPLNPSATAVQSTPIVTVPATSAPSPPTVKPPVDVSSAPVPPPHDVGTPPVFAATIQNVPGTNYAPVVPFAPTILSPAATCAGIIPGQR